MTEYKRENMIDYKEKNNDMENNIYGIYNPVANVEKVDQLAWKKIENAGMHIEENYQGSGITFLNDKVSSIDGAVLGLSRDFSNQLKVNKENGECEYEVSIKLAINNANVTYRYNISFGFDCDDIKDGRSIRLGWFHTDKDEYLLSFIDYDTSGPILNISTLNWNDGLLRVYTIKKYRESDNNSFKIQVLIDGVPQLQEPLDYNKLPVSYSKEAILSVSTSSASIGEYSIAGILFRKLLNIPDKAKISNLNYPEIPLVNLKCSWKAIGKKSKTVTPEGINKNSYKFFCMDDSSELYRSERISVRGNRNYKISGKCSCDCQCITMKIKQYNDNYPEQDPPISAHKLPVQNTGSTGEYEEFEASFYVRIENTYIVIEIEIHGNKSVCNLRDVVLFGGGSYKPIYVPPTKDLIIPIEEVRKTLSIRTKPKAKFKKIDGYMRLLINGKPMAPCYHSGPIFSHESLSRRGYYGQFSEARTRIHEIRIASQPMTGGKTSFWNGKEDYNYDLVDDYLWRVLKSAPNDYIIVGILVDPYWTWGAENPEDVCENQYRQKAFGVMHLTGWGNDPGKANRFLPSVFSQKVRVECSQMLKRLVNYIEASEASKAVIGYYVAGFNDADFGHWTPSGRKELDDYSISAQKAYRDWLKKYYNYNLSELRNNWRQPIESFDSIEIPSEDRRRNIDTNIGPWFSSETHQDVADFNRFYYEELIGLSAALCKTVKEVTSGNKIVITYAGTPMHGWKYSGAGFNKVFDNPADILASPADYAIRLPGYPGGYDTILDSHYLHNKVFVQEQDWRSFTYPTNFENYDFGVGRASTSEEHNAMVKRESGMMLARGQGTYYLDHSNAMYAHPQIMNGITESNNAFEKSLNWKGRPEADVAFFFNEDSSLYLTDTNEAYSYLMRLTRRHRPQWDTSGVPYHIYLQSDLTHKELPEYKVYIFLSPQFICEDELKAIEDIKKDGNLLIFIHSTGIIGSNNPESTIENITGIKVMKLEHRTAYAGEWIVNNHILMKNLSGRFGDRPLKWAHCSSVAKGLAFAVNDSNTIHLARYSDTEHIAFALKDFGTWKSLFCGVPWLESQFINNLAHWAGAWCVSEPHDAIYADQHIVTIHARVQGEKKIRLRYKSNVIDLTTGELLAEGVEEFIVNMGFGETRWFESVKCI